MRKILGALLIISFLVFVATLTIFPIEDADIWFHLATGRWIVEHGWQAPRIDPFSWPIDNLSMTEGAGGQIWQVATEVGMWFLYKSWGAGAIILAKTIIVTLVFLLLIILSLRFGVPLIVSVPLLTMGVLASAERFLVRPEHIGNLWLVILVGGLFLLGNRKLGERREIWGKGEQRFPRYYYVLPLFFLLWTNIHGSVTLGLVVLFIFTILKLAQGSKQWKKILVVAVFSTLMVAINPYGISALSHALNWFSFTSQGKLYLLKTYEFQSPFTGFHPEMPYVFFFRLLLVIYWCAFAVGVYRGRANLFSFFLLSLGTYLAVTHVRYINVFVLLGFLPAVEGLRKISNFKFQISNLKTALLLIALSVILLSASLHIIINGYRLGTTYRTFSLGVKPVIPDRLVAFLDEQNIYGRMLNQYEVGGYLMFAGRKVFMDGRALYPEWFFREYLSMGSSPEAAQAVLDKYEIDYAVVMYPENETGKSVPDYLSQSRQWALVYWDDYYLVFLKRIEKYLPVIDKFGYKYADSLKLSRVSFVERLSREEGNILRRRIIGELEGTVSHNPKNTRAHVLLGSMYEGIGDWDRAISEFQTAINVNPYSPLPYLLQAGILVKRGNYAQAKETIAHALKINSNLPAAYLVLGQIAEKEKNYKAAMNFYKKALMKAPNLAVAYFRLGILYAGALYNRGKAEEYLLRAIQLGLTKEQALQAKQILQSLPGY